jgi:hypothetical protein
MTLTCQPEEIVSKHVHILGTTYQGALSGNGKIQAQMENGLDRVDHRRSILLQYRGFTFRQCVSP